MKMTSYKVAVLLSLILGVGCSSDPEPNEGGSTEETPFTPPDTTPRARPSLGPVDDDEEPIEVDGDGSVAHLIDLGLVPDEPDMGPPDMDFGMPPEKVCCMVEFAIADPNEQDDELRVVLEGSIEPLSEGIAASFADGVWSVTACVPPDYGGTYDYAFVYDAGGEEVTFREINPRAPRGESFGNEFNTWLGGESCDDIDTSVYSVTSAP